MTVPYVEHPTRTVVATYRCLCGESWTSPPTKERVYLGSASSLFCGRCKMNTMRLVTAVADPPWSEK